MGIINNLLERSSYRQVNFHHSHINLGPSISIVPIIPVAAAHPVWPGAWVTFNTGASLREELIIWDKLVYGSRGKPRAVTTSAWTSLVTTAYNTIQYNTTQCNAMQCNATQRNATQRNAMQGNSMQCNAMQCNAIHCNAMQCNAMQYNTIQCNAIQYNTIK